MTHRAAKPPKRTDECGITFPELPAADDPTTSPYALAERFAAAGFPAVPVRGKVTYTAGGFRGATINPSSFGSSWAEATGVGIAPGSVDINGRSLVALDLDGADQISAADEWLTAGGASIDETVQTRSGRISGGLHVWFDVPADLARGFTTGVLKMGDESILVRGSGGYVVAPGSAYHDQHGPTDRTYSYTTDVRVPTTAPGPLLVWLHDHQGGDHESADDETVAEWVANVEAYRRDVEAAAAGGDEIAAKRLTDGRADLAEAVRRMAAIPLGSRHDESRRIVWSLVHLIQERRVVIPLVEIDRALHETFLDLPTTSGTTGAEAEREWSRLWHGAFGKVAAKAASASEGAEWVAEVIHSLPEFHGPDLDDDGRPLGGTVMEGEGDPWAPINLAEVIAAGLEPIAPDVIYRADGEALLYSGKLNVLFGAPEAGKSLVATIFVSQLIDGSGLGLDVDEVFGGDAAADEVVAVYIDFEDDARTYLTRLAAAGTDVDRAARLTRYYSARRPLKTADTLDGFDTARLVIVDTTNAAMAIDGGDPLSNSDALQFIERLKVIRRRAPRAAWVIIDHEPISADGARRQAIGAQAKFGAVDGVQYRVVANVQPRPDHEGVIHLVSTKDRPGGVRRISADPVKGEATQHTATVILDPTGNHGFDATILPPAGTAVTEMRRAILDEFAKARDLDESDGWLSASQMRGRVTGKNDRIDEVIKDLYTEGLTEIKAKGAGNAYRLKPRPKAVATIADKERDRRAAAKDYADAQGEAAEGMEVALVEAVEEATASGFMGTGEAAE